MKRGYPNLELIEYKIKTYCFPYLGKAVCNQHYPSFKADVFLQIWANTATGFNLIDGFSGQAITAEYTTVMEIHWFEDKKLINESEDVIYAVFFGNDLAYAILNPNEKFIEDLNKRTMLAQKQALESYGGKLL